MHLIGKEDLLEADHSTGGVVVDVAVEKTAVSEALTVAVARLLDEDAGDLLGDAVDLLKNGVREAVRGKGLGVGLAGFGGLGIRRDLFGFELGALKSEQSYNKPREGDEHAHQYHLKIQVWRLPLFEKRWKSFVREK